MPPMPPHHWPAPRPTPQALRAHQDAEGVAVWDFIIDQALEVDGLQLEVDGDVDQPGYGLGLGLGLGVGYGLGLGYPLVLG